MSIYHRHITMPNREEILRRKQYLEKLCSKLEARINAAPPGSLVINQKKRTDAAGFYQVLPGRKRVYLNAGNQKLIRQLAQKEYDRKALAAARRELRQLEAMHEYIASEKVEDALLLCRPEKQAFIRPLVETDQAFRERWLSQKYIANPYAPEEKIFPTERGDRVRSKSEGQQADYLFHHDYAYLYEKQVELWDGQRKVFRYPDFTILDPVTRTEVIFEHFGMADDENYLRNNMEKLRLYLNNGYTIGQNLLFTFETRDAPFTIDQFIRVLEARFKK